jgi:hypothetical protein
MFVCRLDVLMRHGSPLSNTLIVGFAAQLRAIAVCCAPLRLGFDVCTVALVARTVSLLHHVVWPVDDGSTGQINHNHTTAVSITLVGRYAALDVFSTSNTQIPTTPLCFLFAAGRSLTHKSPPPFSAFYLQLVAV